MSTYQNQRQNQANQITEPKTFLHGTRTSISDAHPNEDKRKIKAIQKITKQIPEFQRITNNMERITQFIANVQWQVIESLSLYIEYSIPLQYFPKENRELFYYMASLCNIPEFSDYENLQIEQIQRKYAMKTSSVAQSPLKSADKGEHMQIEELSLESIEKTVTLRNQNEVVIEKDESVEIIYEKLSQDNDDKTSVGFSVQNQTQQKDNAQKKPRYSFLTMNEFIQSFKRLPLKQQNCNVSKEVLQSVEKMNSWSKKQQTVKIFESRPNQRKQKMNRNLNKKSQQSGSQMVIQLSQRPSLSSIDEKKPRGSTMTIIVGSKQSSETKQTRNMIKVRAEDNFISKKQREELSFSNIQKAVKEIHFQLNKVSPGNIKHIFQVLKPYIIGKKQSVKNMTIPISLGLIKMIIEKCETEHNRYIGTYAQLLSMFSKIPKHEFVIENSETEQVLCSLSKGNKFKNMLVDAVQEQFHEKLQNRKQIESSQIRGIFRHAFLGLLRLIAQLLKQKVLSKKIANICLSNMTLNLLKIVKQQKNCTTKIYKGVLQNYVQIYIHGAIQFLTDMSNHLEYRVKIQDKQTSSIITKVRIMLNLQFSKQKDAELFETFCLLKVQDFLSLIEIFNQSSFRQGRSTLQTDILIQNYKDNILNDDEELENSYPQQKVLQPEQSHHDKDHNSISKVAPRIRKIFEQGLKENNQSKEYCQKLLNQLFKQSRNQATINLRCLLRLIADSKKQNVFKNLQNLKKAIYQLEDAQIWTTLFKVCWKKQFEYLSTQFFDMKQLTDVIAQLIHISMKLSNGDIKQYVVISSDQDEVEFMDQILEKYYITAKLYQ